METNEQMKSVLRKTLEDELERFLGQVNELAEGDLERLEEQAVKTSQAMGRNLLEAILNSRLHEQRPQARREGSCGHVQRLVGERPKELITLLGKVTVVRAYYQCLPGGKPEEGRGCTHGEAPADVLWGVHEQRTTKGVQCLISYLSARQTFEEAGETLCRCVPIGMSGRQALTLMRPVGEALAAAEDRQVHALRAAALQARSQTQARREQKGIERLYIELDGVLARMRRGSVLMEKDEQQRKGDIYRESKAGAVFCAERGSKRSELAPGVYVDTPAEDTLRYVARRTAKGGFDWLLYQLALHGGLEQAQQVVVVGDGAPWIWNLAAEHFPGPCRSLISIMPKSMCGTWPTPSLEGQPHPPRPGRLLLARCSNKGRVKRSSRPIPPEPGQARSIPERAVDYFTTNAERMRYPLFRAQGMHIGSGIAEAACKTIVSTRAKRSGMRWTPEGIDALLPLRTAVLNGAYDSFWEEEYAA